MVSALNRTQSSRIRHGMSLPAPITPLRATAAIPITSGPSPRGPGTRLAPVGVSSLIRSDRDRGLDPRVGLVALDHDVLETEVVDVGDGGVEAEGGQRPGFAGQLPSGLVEVVQIEMGVAEGVDEVAHREVTDLRYQVGQQRVRGDVERHTEEDVGRALVELAGQPTALVR